MTVLSAIRSTTNHVIDGRFLPDMELLWMVKLVLYVLFNVRRVSDSVSTSILKLNSLKFWYRGPGGDSWCLMSATSQTSPHGTFKVAFSRSSYHFIPNALPYFRIRLQIPFLEARSLSTSRIKEACVPFLDQRMHSSLFSPVRMHPRRSMKQGLRENEETDGTKMSSEDG